MSDNQSWVGSRLEAHVIHSGANLIEVNGVKGYLLGGDIDILYQAARTLPKRAMIVEIGSFMGLSALVMARALFFSGNYASRVVCIDTWEGSIEHASWDVVKAGKLYDIFRTNIENSGLATYFIPIRKLSAEAANDFADKSLDLIFIDGDHSFEGCYSDLVSWYPKLKLGGIFFGHDCSPHIFGVRRAVEEFTKERGLQYTVLGIPPDSHYMYKVEPAGSIT